jgi:hypothetical protein
VSSSRWGGAYSRFPPHPDHAATPREFSARCQDGVSCRRVNVKAPAHDYAAFGRASGPITMRSSMR